MNHRRQSFQRKVAYLVAMALLLLPISWLAMPRHSMERRVHPRNAQSWVTSFIQAGKSPQVLARMRTDKGMALANLGEIDPGSQAVKLASLGFHGVAVTLLWQRSQEYKMKESWSRLDMTLDQLLKLQPHFVSVWRFQAWNISYNVSVEWDDYRQRYRWVVEGIEKLDQGQKYNADTRLYWDEGWFTAYKIGRSDEYLQFRRLFRDPNLYQFPKLYNEPPVRDNWLYGRSSFMEAVEMVDPAAIGKLALPYERPTPHSQNPPVRLRGTSPVLFFSEPAKCVIRYAGARCGEGQFGDVTRQWWQNALEQWRDKFGNYPIQTYLSGEITMEGLAKAEERVQQTAAALDELLPGQRKRIEQAKIDQLPSAVRTAFNKAPQERTPEEVQLVGQYIHQVVASHQELAQAAPPHLRQRAEELAKAANEAEVVRAGIRQQQHTINYEYWKTRCEAERSPEGMAARELLHKAHGHYRQDEASAKAPFETAFQAWRALLNKYPILVSDGEIGDDLIPFIRRYEYCLEKNGEPWPQDFVLSDVIAARQPYPPIPRTARMPPPGVLGRPPAVPGGAPTVVPPSGGVPSPSGPPRAAPAHVPAPSGGGQPLEAPPPAGDPTTTKE